MASKEYPLVHARMAGIIIAGFSFPYSFAAIFTSHAAVASILTFIALTISGLTSAIELLAHRLRRQHRSQKSASQPDPYPPVEACLDAFGAVFLVSLYIAQMVIFSKRPNYWRGYNDSAVKYVPQVEANLACLLVGLVHSYAFLRAAHHRYQIWREERNCSGHAGSGGRVGIVLCPNCSAVGTPAGSHHSGSVAGPSGVEWHRSTGGVHANNDPSPMSTGVMASGEDAESRPLLMDEDSPNQEGDGAPSMGRPSTDMLRYSEDTVAVTVTDDEYRDEPERQGAEAGGSVSGSTETAKRA